MARQSEALRVGSREEEEEEELARLSAGYALVGDSCPLSGAEVVLHRRAVQARVHGSMRLLHGQWCNNCGPCINLRGTVPHIRYLPRLKHAPKLSAVAVQCGNKLPPPLLDSDSSTSLRRELTLFPKQSRWQQVENRLRNIPGGPQGAAKLHEVASSSEEGRELNERYTRCKNTREQCNANADQSSSSLRSGPLNGSALGQRYQPERRRSTEAPQPDPSSTAGPSGQSKVAKTTSPTTKSSTEPGKRSANGVCDREGALQRCTKQSRTHIRRVDSTDPIKLDPEAELTSSQRGLEELSTAQEQREGQQREIPSFHPNERTWRSSGEDCDSYFQAEPDVVDEEDEQLSNSSFEPFDYPCGKSKVMLEWEEWRRLFPGELLNDNVVDFFIAYAMREARCRDVVIAESPFFFAKLPDDTDISTHDTQRRLEEVCTRWPNASKAASATIFLVPVCSSVHWSLFAVYKFYDLFWSEGGEACIMHWDSRRPLHRGLEGRIRAFVQKMLQIHGATDSGNVFDYDKLPLREMSMPQQVNGTDCGYLMLYAAMSVCNNAKSPQHLELSESVSAEEKTRRMRAILRNLFRNKGQLDKGDNTISRNH